MPRTFTVPARMERVCEPCEFHKCVGSMHVRIGPGGWREYNCMHPDAYNDTDSPALHDPEKEKIRQRLIGRLLKEGRHIGRTERQPTWCPLKRETPTPLEKR